MSTIKTIVETVNNQVAERETPCLSMNDERTLVDEVGRLRSALELIRDSYRSSAPSDIARMVLEPLTKEF